LVSGVIREVLAGWPQLQDIHGLFSSDLRAARRFPLFRRADCLVWTVALFGGEVLFLGATSTLFVSLGSLAGVVGAYAILIPLTIINHWPIDYLLTLLAARR